MAGGVLAGACAAFAPAFIAALAIEGIAGLVAFEGIARLVAVAGGVAEVKPVDPPARRNISIAPIPASTRPQADKTLSLPPVHVTQDHKSKN